jgi:acyl-CoA thioester hydrolase
MNEPGSIDAPLISRLPIRVRYSETDRMGVVYHGRYLEWFEMGRVELMRHSGLLYRALEDRGLFFPVTEIWSRYRKSSTFDDELVLESWYVEVTAVRVSFGYRLLDTGGELVAEGISVHAALGKDRTLATIPESIRRMIEPHILDRGHSRSHLAHLRGRRS